MPAEMTALHANFEDVGDSERKSYTGAHSRANHSADIQVIALPADLPS